MPRNRNLNIGAKSSRVVNWLIFTVTLALVPLIARFMFLLVNRVELTSDFKKAILDHFSPNGEILIISVTIVAEGLSDLFSRVIGTNTKTILGGAGIIFIIIFSSIYAAITLPESVNIGNPDFLKRLSILSFVVSLVIGFLCKTVGRS